VWIDKDAVRQAAVAGEYAHRFVPRVQPVAYVVELQRRDALTFARWRNVILASVPPGEINRSRVLPSSSAATRDQRVGAVIAIGAYAPKTVAGVDAAGREQLIADGVAVLRGPHPTSAVRSSPPAADMTIRVALPIAALIITTMYLAGAGWAWVLLPPDAAIRALLSPAFGTAAMVLPTLLWALAGLSLRGGWMVVPSAIGAVTGWVAAAVMGRRG
jgi:hypothetical protein